MNIPPENAPSESEQKSWQERGALVMRQTLTTSWLYEIDPVKPAWLFVSLMIHALLFFILTRL